MASSSGPECDVGPMGNQADTRADGNVPTDLSGTQTVINASRAISSPGTGASAGVEVEEARKIVENMSAEFGATMRALRNQDLGAHSTPPGCNLDDSYAIVNIQGHDEDTRRYVSTSGDTFVNHDRMASITVYQAATKDNASALISPDGKGAAIENSTNNVYTNIDTVDDIILYQIHSTGKSSSIVQPSAASSPHHRRHGGAIYINSDVVKNITVYQVHVNDSKPSSDPESKSNIYLNCGKAKNITIYQTWISDCYSTSEDSTLRGSPNVTESSFQSRGSGADIHVNVNVVENACIYQIHINISAPVQSSPTSLLTSSSYTIGSDIYLNSRDINRLDVNQVYFSNTSNPDPYGGCVFANAIKTDNINIRRIFTGVGESMETSDQPPAVSDEFELAIALVAQTVSETKFSQVTLLTRSQERSDTRDSRNFLHQHRASNSSYTGIELFEYVTSLFQDASAFRGSSDVAGWEETLPFSHDFPMTSAKLIVKKGARVAYEVRYTRHEESESKRRKLEEISVKLTAVFSDEHRYRTLLSLRGSEAQDLLDVFHMILNMHHDNTQSPSLWRNLIVATQRLSSGSGLYPYGFLLFGIPEVEEAEVESGGFGIIHKGIYYGEEVAIKTLKIKSSLNRSRVTKAVAQESVLWAQLRHPSLLPFLGLSQDELGNMSIISPWAENGSVVRFLVNNPSVDRILLCSDTTSGLKYLHDNDIVHGDLKGENVLIDQSGRAYVADFGLSSIDDPDILAWASQSRASSKGGTIRWQAPELIEPVEPEADEESVLTSPLNTKETDVYAWSCVCYEVLTGRLPFFEYRNEYTVLLKVMQGKRPTRPSQNSPRLITDDMWSILQDAWERAPQDRPSIADVSERLARITPPDNRAPATWRDGRDDSNRRREVDLDVVSLRLENLLGET